jgi:hypothetical protein
MATQIDVYCHKNQIAPKLANHIQLVFEEAMRVLLSAMAHPVVQAAVEYSAITETAEWLLRYEGAPYDITAAEITEEQKNAISHRGKALRAMADYLKSR